MEDVNTAASQESGKKLKGISIQQNCTFAAVWHFFNDLFSLYLISTLNFLLGSIRAWHAQFKCAKKQVSSVTTFFFFFPTQHDSVPHTGPNSIPFASITITLPQSSQKIAQGNEALNKRQDSLQEVMT